MTLALWTASPNTTNELFWPLIIIIIIIILVLDQPVKLWPLSIISIILVLDQPVKLWPLSIIIIILVLDQPVKLWPLSIIIIILVLDQPVKLWPLSIIIIILVLDQPVKLWPAVTQPLYFNLQIKVLGVSWAVSLSLSLWVPSQRLVCFTGHFSQICPAGNQSALVKLVTVSCCAWASFLSQSDHALLHIL